MYTEHFTRRDNFIRQQRGLFLEQGIMALKKSKAVLNSYCAATFNLSVITKKNQLSKLWLLNVLVKDYLFDNYAVIKI